MAKRTGTITILIKIFQNPEKRWVRRGRLPPTIRKLFMRVGIWGTPQNDETNVLHIGGLMGMGRDRGQEKEDDRVIRAKREFTTARGYPWNEFWMLYRQ
jgi:hypothetical protein